ncbi:peptide-methionine (S)-S-oxide reductase [Flavobacterium sp. AG291]|uniref:peptide-methionine (S)-S-oxide reductase n=1 Tax=Flavobacterium sp. AG291 TaxID=2184000 RepID=UPI000E0B378D|nr:peptide-methionine (S)-S-oxide reductase [Flavobacterium sp. AG291]RDI10405.1 peptide-methionine (S)-S-oxide reductase [Flavobacterium sp. AG291]
MFKKAGFGGGCHWCTEAVFSSLQGVKSVKQGWIGSTGNNSYFSEGVIIEFDESVISFEILIAIHLYTHSSTSQHSMRGKYRSAVYVFDDRDAEIAMQTMDTLQSEFNEPFVTKVLPFKEFSLSRDELLDYYFSNPQKPFCERYITPKLKLIMERFSNVANNDKLKHL